MTTYSSDRRLPVGVQSFSVIRTQGYLYVDKTDLVWQLANSGKKYCYLSRPRRFGKSVLIDTLQAYFEGHQELYDMVLPALTLRKVSDVQSVQSDLMLALQLGQLPHARRCPKALIADVPYSNKKLASMDMEERYRLIMSTIFNAIGCHVEVEHMMANGRDMVVEVTHFIYVMELKLTNNGGLASAERQIRDNCYTAPFRADKRKVIALAVELDNQGKGLIDWKEVTT